ncbi:MAG: DUF6526 family protein [Dehalococcoidia bacterium]
MRFAFVNSTPALALESNALEPGRKTWKQVMHPLLVLTLIGSCVNLYDSWGDPIRLYSASLIVVLVICVLMLMFFCRIFALKAQDRGVMRAGYPILHSGRRVSELTSGGFSPTLGVSIGMAYLPPELAAAGTELEVDVRGRPLRAQVVRRPFYKRPKAG